MAIGTSAGGVEALVSLAKRLPAAFPASILVTIHLPNYVRSTLDTILSERGALPVSFAQNGEPLRKQRIFIAPPGAHLLVDGTHLALGLGPRENSSRPAIDPMLRSAAVCCGPRVIGVVLTGTLGDGAAGLQAIHQCGGITVVQDPKDAAFPEMPTNAIDRVNPDHLVRLADLPALLESLVHQPAGEVKAVPANIRYEVEIARSGASSMQAMDRLGTRSPIACPDCGGVMWEIDDDRLLRYRCHVGHAYTAETMSLALDESLRRALASALRALEERVALAEKLRRRSEERGHQLVTSHWADKKAEFNREAGIIREAIKRADEIAAKNADQPDSGESLR